MYAQFHTPIMVIPGVALFLLALLSTQWLSGKFWLLLLIAGAVCAAYLNTGLPFLRESSELDVQIMFLTEFILIIIFLSTALWSSVRKLSNLLSL